MTDLAVWGRCAMSLRSWSLLLLLLTLPLAAQQSTDALPPDLPGQMVDIGGYRLHLYCIGHGSPTVILEYGVGDLFADWAFVQPEIAKFTRVCSYDRAYEGFSDVGPVPPTMHQEVYEAHLMLRKAKIAPPYLLVGHSSGGMVARLYTMTYPREVAGLVLVDALHEDTPLGGSMFRSRATGRKIPAPQTMKSSPPLPPTPEETERYEKVKKQQERAKAPLGPPLNRLPADAQRWHLWVLAHPKLLTGSAQNDPMIWVPEELQQIHDARQGKVHPFGDIPVFVIGVTRDNPVSMEERRRQLDDMATLSSNSKVVIDQNSGHHVQWDDPSLVVNSVKETFTAIKLHQQLSR